MRISTNEVQNAWTSEQIKSSSFSAPTTQNTAATGDGLELSGPAELMNKLQQLKENDPEKFREIVLSLAAEVAAQAEETGGFEGDMMSKLAEDLNSVAETGDLSALQPPQPPQGQKPGGPGNAGGPPPGGGPGGSPPPEGIPSVEEEEEEGETTLAELLEAYLEKLATATTDATATVEDPEEPGTSSPRSTPFVVENGLYGPDKKRTSRGTRRPETPEAIQSLMASLNNKLSEILTA